VNRPKTNRRKTRPYCTLVMRNLLFLPGIETLFLGC